LPFLLWAAARFGSFVSSLFFMLFALLSIWGALDGRGPFVLDPPFGKAWYIQLFLIGVSVPLLLLSAAIQEMRESQVSLHRKERKLSLALTAADISTWRWRISHNRLSRSLEQGGISDHLFDHREKTADLYPETFLRMLHPEDRADVLHVIENAAAQGDSFETEFRILRADGAVRHVLSKGAVHFDEGGYPIEMLGVNVDITERRLAETEAKEKQEELTHLARVVILGQLSGALAHELNQPLSSILTNAQVARRLLSRENINMDEIMNILEDIIDADKRAGDVIRHLRALFMKGEPKLQATDINQAILKVLELARNDLILRKIIVVLQLDGQTRQVQADPVQLQQVLLNLLVNACEAMSSGSVKRRQLTIGTRFDDSGMQITFSDTGMGIAADQMDQVFESFFTTKEHGMGFGLSISHAIIAKHGGSIEAMNNPDGGATFSIMLPVQAGGSP
jgi:C4-dicarboxylate-specific signal transduction histidine kinase